MLHLSSDELRSMIAGAIHCSVEECSCDNGMMATHIVLDHDECPVYIPIIKFLAASYGVDETAVRLNWNPYDWRYSADVLLDQDSPKFRW